MCPPSAHQCYSSKCPSCQKFVIAASHRCHLKKIEPKKPSEKLIFFDFETDQSTGQHIVNLAVAQKEDGSEYVFPGYNACNDFCTWLFSEEHKGYTAIAHNMKAFDGQFILSWLIEQGTKPDIIPNGSLLMLIRHKALQLRIIDSINFMPMALSKLPVTFNLVETRKGFFPHLFNTPQNHDFIGSIPDDYYYTPDAMSSSVRAEFFKWYEQQKDKIFNFKEEILAYCRSDVDILRRSCLIYRKEFLDVGGVDPFQCVTIASASMAIFRSRHIKENTIAMVPVSGYTTKINYSPDSIRWLDFSAVKDGFNIIHALNGTGEVKIENTFVDGFCEDTNTVYQFHGCFYHGCLNCYKAEQIHPFKNVAMGDLRQSTEENTQKLRSLGYNVIECWEHEFQKMKEDDEELKTFLLSHKLKDRLVPRDAFYGGRTNAVKLYHEGNAKYVDFTSLYPWVNKYCEYPVGHPLIITENFASVENYFGIMKCTIVPPRQLYLPVLPYRSNKKLMFPLCRVCADSLQQSPCTHTDDERALTGTWVTEEVKMALKKGYEITEVHEVYHFEETSSKLFNSFIDLFLKIKQESSGWPAECATEDDKINYIEDYLRKEGVALDISKIMKNLGRRAVAKLILNSFWGR
ncbi:uncharacterized protein [Parasteatoda tepidariorum]|uniref:uncharacterized protein n=1 Tax=Parasteatoda tepidariorum TaxID=114398 RepID=UPI0039BC4F2F